MSWGKPSVPQVVLGLLTLAVVSAPIIAASTSTVSFSPYNDDWNGASELRSLAAETDTQVVVGHSTTAYQEARPNGTIAFVLSPNSSYSSLGVTRMKEFVQEGGTLVVADDFGPHANTLLRSLNASARLNGDPLRDPRSNYRTSAMPVATNVTNHSLTAGVERITLNYGTTVEPNDARTLINTSEFAYLDDDRNGQLGPNESLGNYPVATVERIGGGRVVVVGDPSVFVNAMLERPGNRRFARVLLAQHDTLLLDFSQSSAIPPLVLAVQIVQDSALLQLAIGALVVAALGVWTRRPGLGSGFLAAVPRPWQADESRADDVRPTAAELATYLERTNPDWDRERVERVVSALERRRNR